MLPSIGANAPSKTSGRPSPDARGTKALRDVATEIPCRFARDTGVRAGLGLPSPGPGQVSAAIAAVAALAGPPSPVERLVAARRSFNQDYNGLRDRLQQRAGRLVKLALDAPPEIAQGIRGELVLVREKQQHLLRVGAAERALRGDVPNPLVAAKAYDKLRAAMTADPERTGPVMREVAELVRVATRTN